MKKQLSLSCTIASILLLTACGSSESKQMTNKEITSSSGLKYIITQEGTGDSPKRGQAVTVHYTGWLQNPDGSKGKKFDSSVDRGQAFVFPLGLGRVIKGWDEGVATMKVGEKRTLIIPAALGYGAQGAGALIPGNATLIFDVELLKFN